MEFTWLSLYCNTARSRMQILANHGLKWLFLSMMSFERGSHNFLEILLSSWYWHRHRLTLHATPCLRWTLAC